jgi:hypothetical protein
MLACHRRLLAAAAAAAGLTLAAGLAVPGQAHAGGSAPFCAFDNQTGYEHCTYVSFQECVWEMRAQGGYCYRNPFFADVRVLHSYARAPRHSKRY